MKARIRETGEIIDVEECVSPVDMPNCIFYIHNENNGHIKYYSQMELDFGSYGHSKQIDWEQRRYEIAKAAMQGMLCNPAFPEHSKLGYYKRNIAGNAISYADELIKQLKGE